VGVPDTTRWKGRWNHYAFVKQGDSKRIFWNGTLLAEGKNTENLNAIRSFFLGSGAGGSGTYHGRIDDVAIWDEALNAALIQALASGTSPLEIRRFGALISTDLGAAMRGVNASALVRIPFTVTDPSAIDLLLLRVQYDDGFVAWLNGKGELRPAPAAARLAQLYLLQREPWNGISPLKRLAIGNEQMAMAELLNQLYRPTFVAGLGRHGSCFLALARLLRQAPLTTLFLPDTISKLVAALTATDLMAEEQASSQTPV
jgi:hypothetical protein